ncbi:unnamed protein product [Effrenium voratum]|nr:unnamed protein product [Effrenium voratum]
MSGFRWAILGALCLCLRKAPSWVSPWASRPTMGITAGARSEGSRLARGAVMSPPPRTAPPETSEKQASKSGEWLECLIQHEHKADTQKKHAEVWVLRRRHFNFFRRLLMLRGFHAFSSTSELKCRDRTIDVSMNCVDCVRLLQGGFYGHMGVAVPAHPPQSSVNGCLALSQALNVSAHPADDQTSGSWDSARTSQYAFCQQAAARPPPLFRRLTQGTSLDGREDVGEKLAHRRWFKPDGYDHHAIFVAWQENPEGFVVHHPIGKRTNPLRGKIRHEVRNLRDYTLARALAVQRPSNPDEVLQRALSRVGESGYNLIWKNCEHFTEWCMTGQHRSRQVFGALVGLPQGACLGAVVGAALVPAATLGGSPTLGKWAVAMGLMAAPVKWHFVVGGVLCAAPIGAVMGLVSIRMLARLRRPALVRRESASILSPTVSIA